MSQSKKIIRENWILGILLKMINFKTDKFGIYDPYVKTRLLVHTDIGTYPIEIEWSYY